MRFDRPGLDFLIDSVAEIGRSPIRPLHGADAHHVMSDHSVVSVIVPAGRAEAILPGTLRSLPGQIYPTWQAIIFSDNGVDDLTVLERAGLRDDTLQAVFTAAFGSGEGNARDVALAAARATLPCKLDTEDDFRADRLEFTAVGGSIDHSGIHAMRAAPRSRSLWT